MFPNYQSLTAPQGIVYIPQFTKDPTSCTSNMTVPHALKFTHDQSSAPPLPSFIHKYVSIPSVAHQRTLTQSFICHTTVSKSQLHTTVSNITSTVWYQSAASTVSTHHNMPATVAHITSSVPKLQTQY